MRVSAELLLVPRLPFSAGRNLVRRDGFHSLFVALHDALFFVGYERNSTFLYFRVSVSVYLGTTINKQQILPQKTNRIRTAFILFPRHLKQLYGFLVRCPDK